MAQTQQIRINPPLDLVLKGAAALALVGVFGSTRPGPDGGVLEEIVVTAQKREEALQDVPISVATTSGRKPARDVLWQLTTCWHCRVVFRVCTPNHPMAGRHRASTCAAWATSTFDLAASQPVSLIMDEVVMENVVLKSFPLFDLKNIEVIRGPQGTLFGRNTTAGIVKVNTSRPADETSGYIRAS